MIGGASLKFLFKEATLKGLTRCSYFLLVIVNCPPMRLIFTYDFVEAYKAVFYRLALKAEAPSLWQQRIAQRQQYS